MYLFHHPGWNLDKIREEAFNKEADWKLMYSHMVYAADRALTLLEEGKEKDAAEMLSNALLSCEEMYISEKE